MHMSVSATDAPSKDDGGRYSWFKRLLLLKFPGSMIPTITSVSERGGCRFRILHMMQIDRLDTLIVLR